MLLLAALLGSENASISTFATAGLFVKVVSRFFLGLRSARLVSTARGAQAFLLGRYHALSLLRRFAWLHVGGLQLSFMDAKLRELSVMFNRQVLIRQMTPDSPLEAKQALGSLLASEDLTADSLGHIPRLASVVTLL